MAKVKSSEFWVWMCNTSLDTVFQLQTSCNVDSQSIGASTCVVFMN